MSNTPITKSSSSSPLPQTSASTQSDQISTVSRQTIVSNKSSTSIKSVPLLISLLIEADTLGQFSGSPSRRSTKEIEPIIEQQKNYPLQTAKGDEHKCISTPEPPHKMCKCCKCSSSSAVPESEDSSNGRKSTCICGSKNKKKCRCGSLSNTGPSCK